MTKLILMVTVLFAAPAFAGGSSKPPSARTQAHADRAAKDAAKTNDPRLAASRQKLADQRAQAAERQRKNEARKK